MLFWPPPNNPPPWYWLSHHPPNSVNINIGKGRNRGGTAHACFFFYIKHIFWLLFHYFAPALSSNYFLTQTSLSEKWSDQRPSLATEGHTDDKKEFSSQYLHWSNMPIDRVQTGNIVMQQNYFVNVVNTFTGRQFFLHSFLFAKSRFPF